MKKNLTLISLMFSVLMIVSVIGMVSAVVPDNCTVKVLSPIEGNHYDPLWINWTYIGNCNPSTYTLQYGPDCNGVIWDDIATLPSNTVPMSYWWDPAQENVPSGQYCIRVRMDPAQGDHISGYSGMWNLDLAKPYVNMSIGTPQTGSCDEGTGNCYVTQGTEITLTCNDDNPDESWQSGADYIQYQINNGDIQNYTEAFSFEEDSNHVLKYWCYDKVGKKSEEKTRNIYVNSEAPTLSRTVGEPKVSGCDSIWGSCNYYITQDTKICISATKGNSDHPTPGDLTYSCSATRWLNSPEGNGDKVGITLDANNCFDYNEDSYHELSCTATDALGNQGELTKRDIVDTAAPKTTLSYLGPNYNNEGAQWIDTVSRINLTATDSQPHPVGVDKTFYLVKKNIDASWCYGTNTSQWQETSKSDSNWMEYTSVFGLDEGCNAIEYYSNDSLGNSEDVNTMFVFSDHTAPETVKVVGDPKVSVNSVPLENWSENPGQNIEYKITTDTPISISCNDVGSNPSGVGDADYSGIYYRVVLDGHYSDKSAAWRFLKRDSTTVYFNENSEHLLEFYCVDNVNKTSATDSELFKVEGKAFTLRIGDKWDLISVPFNLLSSDPASIFGNSSEIQNVWGYENGTWKVYYPDNASMSTLTKITPGLGYWVKTTGKTSVLIGGELFNPQTVPSSVNLNSGWNLIGKYGTGYKASFCDLFSLTDAQGNPQWASLVGYNPKTQGFYGLNLFDNMRAGNGYWLGMKTDGLYFPSTVCPICLGKV
jgi:hypothetical protein